MRGNVRGAREAAASCHALVGFVMSFSILLAMCALGSSVAASDVPAIAVRAALVAADPQTVRMSPANAAAKLEGLVALQPDKPTAAEWTLSGAANAAGLVWARVTFQAGAKAGSWEFVKLQIALEPGAKTLDTVVSELTKKLGRGTRPNAQGERVWAVRKRAITVDEGLHVSPIDDSKRKVVLVDVSMVQGEAD